MQSRSMQYLVKGEFLDANTAGKSVGEALGWLEMVVRPSLEILAKAVDEKKITGGPVAGVRETIFILDVSSNEEVGTFLRSLPYWRALKWAVTPLQSFRSVLDQDKVAFAQARKMAESHS